MLGSRFSLGLLYIDSPVQELPHAIWSHNTYADYDTYAAMTQELHRQISW